ncbi:uncharacterized protein LOC123536965 [Mercenaria mercenaria]|uniref:uncharacterized protein LOC123536965 n=1 Tax=Mercenaria mercenaria TaxID=6596 RepID=UPI00234F6C43|nr:uncharacterized protein LOC123536965 [Mercenaria mercenaria]
MTEKVKFSSTHGQNVTLTNSSTTATWSTRQSGGWVFSLAPLEQGQTVVVELDGSGHCDLGFIKEDPQCTNVMKQVFKQMNEIRIHKRKCTIPVTLNDKATEVSSRFQEKTFTKTLDQESKMWLALYVKFGKISAKLLMNGSPEYPVMFSNNHGANISLEENNCLASTVLANPASTCFVKDKISIGEELLFQCSPLLEGEREPSRYHLKLHVYERNPESLKKDFRYLFDSGTAYAGEPPVTTLEVFEKEECKGDIVVTLKCDTIVGYRAASSKYNEQTLRVNVADGIWVILELYRTTVAVSKRAKTFSVTGVNVADAAVREPSNVNAENSMDPIRSMQERTELKRQVSDYSEVSDARTPDDNVTERLASLERGHQELHANVKALTQTLQTAVSCNNFSVPPGHVPKAFPLTVASDMRSQTCDREIHIRKNFTQLINNMHCVTLCDKLFEKELITQNEYQNINAETCSPDANRKLLLAIMKRKIMKSTMDKILDETDQGYLKNMF